MMPAATISETDRAAVSRAATVLRARQAEVFPQHLQQRLVRPCGYLRRLAIHLQRDIHLSHQPMIHGDETEHKDILSQYAPKPGE